MATDDENVVGVTLLGLSDDVLGGAVLDDSVDVQVCESTALLDETEQSLANLERDTGGGRVLTLGTGDSTEGTGEGAVDVVVDDSTGSASGASESGLETEFARATGDESNVAGNLSRVVGGVATQVVDGNERSVDCAIGGVGEECSGLALIVDRQSSVTTRVGLNKVLVLDSVIPVELCDSVEEVLCGSVVADAAEDSVSLRGCVGNVLELL